MFKIRVKFELYDSLENGSSVEEVDLSGNNCSELNSLQLLTAAYLLNTLTLKSAKYEFGHTLQQGFMLYKILCGLWGKNENTNLWEKIEKWQGKKRKEKIASKTG